MGTLAKQLKIQINSIAVKSSKFFLSNNSAVTSECVSCILAPIIPRDVSSNSEVIKPKSSSIPRTVLIFCEI